MKASDKRRLKRAGGEIGVLGLGTAPLGGLYQAVSTADARATIAAAWGRGIRFYDTAPMYGLGRCEHLVGEWLRDQDPASFRISSKVGRLMTFERPGRTLPPAPARNMFDSGWNSGLSFCELFDYSYEGVMRSYDDSRQRTGLSRIDILLVHDIGRLTHGERHQIHWDALTKGGGFKALMDLKAAGLIAGFGLGVNEWQAIRDAMQETDLDICLLAGRLTLLDNDAVEHFLPLALRHEVDLVIAGVFNSGILAATSQKKFNYLDAPAEIVARAERLETLCLSHGVALRTAAIQYPLRHKAATALVVGARSAAEIESNVDHFEASVPAELWSALEKEGLIPPAV